MVRGKHRFSRQALSLALLGAALWTSIALSDDETDRKIAPADTLMIEVFGEKDLTVERRVEAGGMINYPLLGNVRVVDKTTAEVAEVLRKMLSGDYLVRPQVSVNVKEYRQRTVSVLGEVEKPGAVKLQPEVKMGIVEAIAEAGGFKISANKNKIKFTRDGKTQTLKFDDLTKQTDPQDRIWLEPGDVIFVPESFF